MPRRYMGTCCSPRLICIEETPLLLSAALHVRVFPDSDGEATKTIETNSYSISFG